MPLLILLFSLLCYQAISQQIFAEPWRRHIIDDSSRGADGVKLADVNGDRLPDITTGWEEGGVTRVYLHPGYLLVTKKWPAVTVGKTPSVEDALFVDLDRDGAVDVISSCEGKTRTMFIHWAPKQSTDYLSADKWLTMPIPATKQVSSWMYAQPMQVDGKQGVDLIIGSKGKRAMVGWLQAPENPRDVSAWKLHQLYSAGWIMSLASHDVDRDGDADIVVSDRKGNTPGVLWLENPGAEHWQQSWREHRIGASGQEVMFIDVTDWNGDGRKDIVAAVKPDRIHWYACPMSPKKLWQETTIKLPEKNAIGTAKAVRAADVDSDGRLDLIYSCEQAKPPKQGLFWLSITENGEKPDLQRHEISGEIGIKFDQMEIVDIDGDGDPDVLTCEERHMGRGLGVIWYENPHK